MSVLFFKINLFVFELYTGTKFSVSGAAFTALGGIIPAHGSSFRPSETASKWCK